MKLIDIVINDIPKVGIETYDNSEIKYVIDSRILLDNLRDFEVDIPQELYDKYQNKFGNGVLQYMEQLTNVSMNDFKGYNTYNWNGRIMHDFDYRTYEMKDHTYYVAIQVHRGGDIRINYTDFVLFKFDYIEQWFEVIEDISREKCGGVYEINNKHYYYDMSMFDEYLKVYCNETQEEFDIYAYNDESFVAEIKEREGV